MAPAVALAALAAQLRSLRAPPLPAGACGSPQHLLPVLSFVLLQFSTHVARLVAQQGLQLRGASDQRLVEGALRFARDVLGLRPPLTAAQFLAEGQFVERRLELVADIARACRELHNAAARQERLAALRACNAQQRLVPPPAATALQQQQQQQVPNRAVRAGSKGGPSLKRAPLPCMRVVGELGAALDAECSSASSGGSPPVDEDDTSPTSVIAAAAQREAGAKPALPAALPAEQPRPLPPPLALARAGTYQQQQYAEPHAQQARMPQPGAGHAAQICAASQMPPPPPPPQQQQQQPPPQQQQQQQEYAIGGCPQLAAAGTQLPPLPPLPFQQGQHLPAEPPPPQHAPRALACSRQHAPLQVQAQQVIEGLELRLGLAEEAAAAAHREEQRAREELQARLTILEGRVRFLEAQGCGVSRPPDQLCALPAPPLPALQVQGPPAPALALAWAGPTGSCSALPFSHAAASGGAAAAMDERPLRLNPLFDSRLAGDPAAPLPPLLCGNWHQLAQPAAETAAAHVPPPHADAAAAAAWQPSPLPVVQEQAPCAAAAPACGTGGGSSTSYSSAAELISSMQARFSEADGFLLSLRRL